MLSIASINLDKPKNVCDPVSTSYVRDSNIELLRIFAICGVIILHYNGSFAFALVQSQSINQYILILLEGLFICAVNVFILISGYFSSVSQKRKAIKVIELAVQVICMKVACYLLVSVFSGGISIKGVLRSAVPNNWYVTLYITIYFISPYINILLNKLTDRQIMVFTILLFVLFAVWPTFVDILQSYGLECSGFYTTNTAGSQYGYSLINFVLMYIIGAFLRRKEYKTSVCVLFISLVACVAVLFFWQYAQPQIARAYCNPVVIALAVIIFLLFKKVNVKNRLVNILSKGTFTCFLVHGIFLSHIGIARFVNASPILLIMHIAASSVAIFLASFIIFTVYDFLTRKIFAFFGKKLVWLDEILSPEDDK